MLVCAACLATGLTWRGCCLTRALPLLCISSSSCSCGMSVCCVFLQALYRGNGANVARLLPDVGFKFAVHDQFKLMFTPPDGSPLGVQEKMAAGAATGEGGCCSALHCSGHRQKLLSHNCSMLMLSCGCKACCAQTSCTCWTSPLKQKHDAVHPTDWHIVSHADLLCHKQPPTAPYQARACHFSPAAAPFPLQASCARSCSTRWTSAARASPQTPRQQASSGPLLAWPPACGTRGTSAGCGPGIRAWACHCRGWWCTPASASPHMTHSRWVAGDVAAYRIGLHGYCA